MGGVVSEKWVGPGCLVGMLAFGLSFPGLGLALFAVFLVSFIGKFIGHDPALLTVYIVVGMLSSYALPVVAAVVTRQIRWILFIPIATSLLLAVPSSFVFSGACESGQSAIAPMAMRTVPLLAGFELFNEDHPISCSSL